MELSERCIAQLEKEGYDTVYEVQLLAGDHLPVVNQDTSVFVSEGSLRVEGDTPVELLSGDRYRPTPGVTALVAGTQGCQLVIGERQS